VLLTETCDITEQQIRKSIIAAHSTSSVIESDVTGNGARAEFTSQFILLAKYRISAELQIVFADDFGDVIAVGINRIGIINSVGNVARVLSEPSVVKIRYQVNAGHDAIAISAKQVSYG